jgi:predicted enzyme related to lactoylglutathione lyase
MAKGSPFCCIQRAGGKKEGQALVKLVFDVEDVPKFLGLASEKGLVFGPIHEADGYVFTNANDPSGNSVSVSSRAFHVSTRLTLRRS